jgi:hypothetical protein
MNTGLKLRYGIDAAGVRGLLLINGGAAVALLAFLPTALSKPAYGSLANGVLWALLLYQAGLVFAIMHNRLRRKCSLAYDGSSLEPCGIFNLKLREPCVCYRSIFFMWLSVAAFCVGGLAAFIGGMRSVDAFTTQTQVRSSEAGPELRNAIGAKQPATSRGQKNDPQSGLFGRQEAKGASAISTVVTALVAILVAIISWRQWLTDRARLKHELFLRRYDIYEEIYGFVGRILTAGRVEPGADIQFLQDTRKAYFVFGCDRAIKSLVTDIYEKAVDLYALEAERPSLADGDARRENIIKQREIKNWFQSTLAALESKFE